MLPIHSPCSTVCQGMSNPQKSGSCFEVVINQYHRTVWRDQQVRGVSCGCRPLEGSGGKSRLWRDIIKCAIAEKERVQMSFGVKPHAHCRSPSRMLEPRKCGLGLFSRLRSNKSQTFPFVPSALQEQTYMHASIHSDANIPGKKHRFGREPGNWSLALQTRRARDGQNIDIRAGLAGEDEESKQVTESRSPCIANRAR